MTTTTLSEAELLSTVAAAVRAPSVHNTQPWLFRLTPDGIDLYADRTRQLTVADPTGRALRVSCGAALFNLRLAFAHLDHATEVNLGPRPGEPNLLAQVVARPGRPATPTQRDLYAAIWRRHSNRYPFLDTALPLEVRSRLFAAAKAEHGWLDLILGPVAQHMITELVREADRLLLANDAYRGELVHWTRPDDSSTDGVPRLAGGPAPQPDDLLVRRDFGGPPRGPRGYEADPLIGVLGSPGDTPIDDLIAGQALQHVLLTATDAGLSASLMSQPIDVPRLREELRLGLRRHGSPQVLLRLGYGVPGNPTPRRPLADVLVTTDSRDGTLVPG